MRNRQKQGHNEDYSSFMPNMENSPVYLSNKEYDDEYQELQNEYSKYFS